MKLTGLRIINLTAINRATGLWRPRPVGFMARTILLFCALIAASPSAPAQNIQYSQGSVGSSLNNTLQIPLGAYRGRGGASLPITLYYSSDLWRIKYRGTIYNSNQVALSEPMADARYNEFSRAGWTSSLGIPILEWPDDNEVYDYKGKSVCLDCSATPRSPGGYYKVPRLTIHMPDGSTHELRRDDQPYTGAVDNTGTFYAVDGSRLRYDNSTSTLYLPDGSRYVLGATTVQFIDRNGNTLEYDRDTKKWTDTLGRVFSLPPLNNVVGSPYYDLPGMSGTTIRYQLRWANLTNVLEPDPATNAPPELQYAGGHYVSGTPSMSNPPQPVQGDSLFDSTYSIDEAYEINEYVIGTATRFNPVVLKELILPNGLSYKFQYNVYGEITKVTYPTGGFEQYQYGQVRTVNSISSPYDQASRGVIRRCVSSTAENANPDCWQYGVTYDNGIYKRWTRNPDNTYSESYLFKAPPTSEFTNLSYPKFGFEDPRNGMPYEERFYKTEGGTLLRRKLIQSTYSSREVSVSFNGQTTTATAMRNPRATKEVSIILDTGGNALAKTLTYSYGNTNSAGAVTTQHEFTTGLDLVSSTESHFIEDIPQATAQSGNTSAVSPDAGPIASTAVTTYLDDENYRSRNILGLPISVVLKNANNQIVSKTETLYDEAAYLEQDPGTVDSWTDPETAVRGNATTARRYATPTDPNSALASHVYYDKWGNPRRLVDVRGNESRTEYSATYAYAYATATTSAEPNNGGPTTALTASTIYDLNTGLVTSTTDANGQTTEFEYADANGLDPMNRLLKVIRPDTSWTSYYYNDVAGNLYVRTTTSLDATRSTESYQYVDGLGRPSRSFASEGGSPATYLTADTQYDSMGRTKRVSNPYRTDGPGDTTHQPEKWTESQYDELGRVKTVILPDGSKVQTTYQGVYTTVKDQADKERRQKTDALGRVVRVDEPDTTGNLGTADAPTQPSYYDYDALGNLVHIKQGTGEFVQHRYFKYDALSRLTHEKQVEQTALSSFNLYDSVTGNSSWSRKLVYDGTLATKGLVTTDTDARGVTTTYTYDNLNRVKQVAYTDGTPTVTNYYDQARGTYLNKGRLTEVKTAALTATSQMPAIPATSQIYDYDLMARVKSHKQTVGTNAYTTSYVYGLGGQLESETYPSGHVVRQTYDGAGRLAGVDNGAGTPYANTFAYGPKGALTSVTLGNGAVQTFDYNDRLQLTTTSLVKNGTTLQRYDYKYGQIDVTTGGLNETKNNGQIARIESFIGTQQQWQQRFGYDSLGRLSQAAEYRGDNNQRSYLIAYDYDSFGNRYQKAEKNPTSTNPLEHLAVEDNQVDKLTNRFLEVQNVLAYDASGNVTLDKKFTQRHYSYDANSRQRTVSTDGTAANAYTSVYDGVGQRVATIFNGQTSVNVYDAMGKLVAEYGQPISNSGIQYVFTDHQGSTRVTTNGSGAVVSRHDYQPFGGEIHAGVGMRVSTQGYDQADLVRQQHAGMEEDEGSTLSHTLWRQQDYLSGRWTSPDPYGGSMSVGDPQSFNRYTYVNNDPVNVTDPSGLAPNIGYYYREADLSWGQVDYSYWGNPNPFNLRHPGGPQALAQGRYRKGESTTYRYDFSLSRMGGGQLYEQVNVLSIEVVTEIIDIHDGAVVGHTSNSDTTVTNTGNAPHEVDAGRRRDMENAVTRIIEISRDMNVEPAVALGIGAEETFLGGGTGYAGNNASNQAMQHRVNPLQFTGLVEKNGNQLAPSATDLGANIRGGLRLLIGHGYFKNGPWGGLEITLGNYGGRLADGTPAYKTALQVQLNYIIYIRNSITTVPQ